jgi:hypothetical protein
MEMGGQLYHWGKDLSTYWIGGWVGPTAGLDMVTKRKKPLCLPGISCPDLKLVTILTELSQLTEDSIITLTVFSA